MIRRQTGEEAMGVEHLAETHNVTVVLRLVVTTAGQLVHGEVVQSDGTATGMFRDWERLIELLEQSARKN